MKKGILTSVAALLSGVGAAWAQQPAELGGKAQPKTMPPALVNPAPTTKLPSAPPSGGVILDEGASGSIVGNGETITSGTPLVYGPDLLQGPPPQSWRLSAEYMLWWFDTPPLPPIVTQGDPLDLIPGALGQPGTRVLLGGRDLGIGASHGLRITGATSLGEDGLFELEANGMFVFNNHNRVRTGTTPQVNPAIYIPVFRAEEGREGSFTISDPNTDFEGNLTIEAASRFASSQVNIYGQVFRGSNLHIDTVGGFKYQYLDEKLIFTANLNDRGTNLLTDYDERFTTRNQFWGGTLGLRFRYFHDWFFGEWNVKVGLGNNHQSVDATGYSVHYGRAPDFGIRHNGAIFTQPTNIEREVRNSFGIAPEFQLKVGAKLHERVVTFVGYDFMAWSNVVRPQYQLDRTVNFTQRFSQPLVGDPSPRSHFELRGFTAHAITFGIEARY